jgi:hypothetical protein
MADGDGSVRWRFVGISGTGRAGTTFLVELLTGLGLDTGFTLHDFPVGLEGKAGLEWSTHGLPTSRIFKSPAFCDLVDEFIARGGRIDHVIIPVRDFGDAAASRVRVQHALTGSESGAERVDGGLWDTNEAADQETVLRIKFTRLVSALVRHDIPMRFVQFPRLVQDAEYLYGKLLFLMPHIGFDRFREVFSATVRSELVHTFGKVARANGVSRRIEATVRASSG